MIKSADKSQVLPLTYDQRNALCALSCMMDGSEYIPEPEPDYVLPKSSDVDYSRDILGSNIASRFGGR
jgi:hypothetical protein